MKSLFLSLFLLVSLSLRAQVETPKQSCAELYAHASAEKITKENKLRERGASVYGLSLAALFTGNIFIVSGFILGGSSMILTANFYDAPEIRANDLKIEGSKRLRKYTEKMQKKLGTQITEMEILSIVNQGMDSGIFCADPSKLASPEEIKSYVAGILESRYRHAGTGN
jgi:hypothetical protein